MTKNILPKNLKKALLTDQESQLVDEFIDYAKNIVENENHYTINWPWDSFLYNFRAENVQVKTGYHSFSDFIDHADADTQIDLFEIPENEQSKFREKCKNVDFDYDELSNLENEFNKKTKININNIDDSLKSYSYSVSILDSLSKKYVNLSGKEMLKLLIKSETFWKQVYK